MEQENQTSGSRRPRAAARILAALLGCQGMGAFRKALGSALDAGVEPVAIREVIYQATAYLGIGRVHDFLETANAVL